MNIYANIFQKLNENGIKYLVVGGIAVNLYGYKRFTADMDIVIALDLENLEKVDNLMNQMSYTPRIPVDLKTLSDDERLKDIIENKNCKAYTYNGPVESLLQIDILIEESLRFQSLYKERIKKTFNDIEIPVIGLDDLIGMKKKANRPKDLEDLDALLDLKLL